MIIDPIINLVADVIAMFFELVYDALETALEGVPEMPDFEIASLSGSVGAIGTWFSWANQYVPIYHAVAISGIYLGSWLVFYTIDVGVYFASKMHLLGGGSQ